MATLYIVRHGHIESQGCFTGQTDVPLSPIGHEQAARLGDLLKEVAFDSCLCSPLSRALETARHILAVNDFWGKVGTEKGPCHSPAGNDFCEEGAQDGTENKHPLVGGHSLKDKHSFGDGYLVSEHSPLGELSRLGGDSVSDGISPSRERSFSQRRDTCSVSAQGLGSMFILPELMEIFLGSWEGMSKKAVVEAYPALWKERGLTPALTAPPHGENYPMLHKRLEPVFNLLAGLESQSNILVVAHRSINQVLMGKLSLLPLEDWPRLVVPHGCVTLCPLRQNVLHGAPIA